MSSPLTMAEFVCDHVSRLRGDFAHHAIPMEYDELPEAIAHYSERRQSSPTSRPIYLLPLGLIAWYVMGNDPKDWPEH